MKFSMPSVVFGAFVILSMGSVSAQSKGEAVDDLNWQRGPQSVRVGYVASQRLSSDYQFLDADNTRRFMEMIENIPSDEIGLIAPNDMSWFATYSYDDVGYIKDDEKESLDADAILKSLREGTERANVERRRRGWPEMQVLGWAQKPHYDEETHNLAWAVKGSDGTGTVVNYNMRLLGRGGYMSVVLVCEPDQLSYVLPRFKSALRGFEYTSGNRYAEYRDGDKVAELGLTALIVGGTAAVAAKTGAFKWLWKGLVFVVVAIGGLLKKIFGGGKKENQ